MKPVDFSTKSFLCLKFSGVFSVENMLLFFDILSRRAVTGCPQEAACFRNIGACSSDVKPGFVKPGLIAFESLVSTELGLSPCSLHLLDWKVL